MAEIAEWKKVFRTTRLVCAAIIASLFIYALIVEILRSQLVFFAGLARLRRTQPLLFAFYGLGIVAVLVTRLVNRRMMKTNESEPLAERLIQLSRGSIVVAVLAELPALFGFVFFLLTGSSRDFYLLWFASLILEFIFFPRSGTWQSLLDSPISSI